MIPDKEVANNSINQEILKLFLNDGCHRKDPRPTFFRNHNREMHSRNMEHVVTQHPCPNRTFIMATAHNICQTLAKLNRKHCFTLSLGFTLIHVWSIQYGVLIGHLCHPMSIMKPLLSFTNHSYQCQNPAQQLVQNLIFRKRMLQRRLLKNKWPGYPNSIRGRIWGIMNAV